MAASSCPSASSRSAAAAARPRLATSTTPVGPARTRAARSTTRAASRSATTPRSSRTRRSATPRPTPGRSATRRLRRRRRHHLRDHRGRGRGPRHPGDRSARAACHDIARVKANINKLSDYLKATGLDYRVVMIAQGGHGHLRHVHAPAPRGRGHAVHRHDQAAAQLEPADLPDQQPGHRLDQRALAPAQHLRQHHGRHRLEDVLRPEAFKAIIPITDDNSALAAASFDTSLLAKAPTGMFGTATARNYAAFPIRAARPTPRRSSAARRWSTTVRNT